MKKILIVEDSCVIITGMVYMLKEIGFDQSLVHATNSFDGMLALMDEQDYELVFFGLKTYHHKHLSSLLGLVQKKPTTAFLVFCETLEINTQRKMYKGGIKGVLNKMASRKEILFAVQRVLDNEIYLDTASSMKLFFSENDGKKIYPSLTRREREVAELLAEGKNNFYIGNTLHIMPSTVSTFKTRIFNKLNIQSVIELKELGRVIANK